MEKFFIHSKHWQVFLLFLVTFVIVQLIFMLALVYSEDTIFTGLVTGLATAGSLGLLLSWYYFLINGMNKKINNPDLKMQFSGIWFFIMFPVIFFFTSFLVFPTGFVMSTEDNSSLSLFWILLIFPLYLFAVFCFFYVVFITAKIIKSAHLQRKVSFVEFAGEFFLLWFFPIGIWFLQPEINKLMNRKTD